MIRLFVDPQGNCTPMTNILELCLIQQPSVFKEIQVDTYIPTWVYLDGEYKEPPPLQVSDDGLEPTVEKALETPQLTNEEITDTLNSILEEIIMLKENN